MTQYRNKNYEVLQLLSRLVDRHPTLKITEILEKFNIIHVDESDRNTNPDTILARTYLRLHELDSAQFGQRQMS